MPLKSIERAIIESGYWADKRAHEVKILFKGIDLEGKKILNIGAGRTSLTKDLLGSSVKKIINIDNEDFPNLDFVACATKLPFKDNEFDMVIFLRVLHHINDFNKALEEVMRCTKSGGYILISEPYDFIVKLTRVTGLDSHPKNIIKRKNIKDFVKENKLKIVQDWRWTFWYYYGFQVQV